MSSKIKLIYVTFGILLLFWLSFRFAIVKTFSLWKVNKSLIAQAEEVRGIPELLPHITNRVAQLENMLGKSGHQDLSALVLNCVNGLCLQNGVLLSDIPEKHMFIDDEVMVETLEINMLGRYTDLLKVCFELEKNEKNGRLRSVFFKLLVNPSNGDIQLQGTVFLQTIHLISDNPKNPLL